MADEIFVDRVDAFQDMTMDLIGVLWTHSEAFRNDRVTDLLREKPPIDRSEFAEPFHEAIDNLRDKLIEAGWFGPGVTLETEWPPVPDAPYRTKEAHARPAVAVQDKHHERTGLWGWVLDKIDDFHANRRYDAYVRQVGADYLAEAKLEWALQCEADLHPDNQGGYDFREASDAEDLGLDRLNNNSAGDRRRGEDLGVDL